MKHPFVLVHGAYHGAWCFEKLMACMEAAGEQVRAVDLPLCPDRATPVSMEDCLRVLEAAIPQGERVILCGHSNGGHFITAFAQLHPDRVAALVYITATLLPDGCSAFDNPTVEDACPKPRRLRNGVCKWYPLETEADYEALWHYFYTGADREEARRAADRIQPQPLDCLGTPNRLTQDRYGRVERYYVLCTGDRCMSPGLQRAMVEAMPCKQVFELESGHSPFLTHAPRLTEILREIGAGCP